MGLIAELKRRNVFRAGVAYLVVAWGVAQVAELVLDAYDIQPWVMQLILMVLGIGFPVAISLSWMFDFRWDGLHWERDVATGIANPIRPVGNVEHESIAVLPFANMSSDPDQEYFSDGISEELLNLLAKIPQLRVAARTSAFSFKAKEIEIPEIGQHLNVAHVLEGSVRRSGSKVRITAQLIRAETGYHLWSETWDRTLEDVFAVQDEIAAAVVEKLKLILLTSAPKMSETDPKAYALFLQARHLHRQNTATAFESAIDLLDEVPDSAMDYAPAWALRSEIYASQSNYGFRPNEEGYCLAREAAERALSIDPNCAAALASLGKIALGYDQNLTATAHLYQRALALDPADPDILRCAGNLNVTLHRLDSAIALYAYLAARDPINPAIHNNLGVGYYLAGRADAAISSCQTTLRLSPGRVAMYYIMAMALLTRGDMDGALKASEQEENQGFRLTAQALAYHALGQYAKSNAALAQLIEEHAHEFAYNIAIVHACLGDKNQAFEWLEKAWEYHDGGLGMINSEPSLAPLHKDPRWNDFLVKIGSSPTQLSAINFEVNLPVVG